ncbi:MAG TPA: hypothetical protein VHM25_02400, partial [Polyangiaceae bacterium]|nr:hypothetical protein [Polyangiaceae bacterium]
RNPRAAVGIDALLPRPEALPEGCYLILTTRPLDSGDVPSQVRKRIEGLDLGSARRDSERHRLHPSGQDPLAVQYRDLLRAYFQQSTRERKLRAEEAARLFEVLLEKSEGLFGYFAHLTDLVADGLLAVGQAQTLPVGAPIYDVFLDALERRVGGGAGGKAWASIQRLLLVMAADERAFDLESAHWNEWLPQRVYRGIPLAVLARLIDLPTVNYELVWVLYAFKHLLASWRGSDRASDLSHWRLGLRDLRTTIERRWGAELMAEHRRAASALFLAYQGHGDEIPYADAAITHQALRAVWHARANASSPAEPTLADSHVIPLNFAFKADLSRRDPATFVQAILAAIASVRDLQDGGLIPKEEGETSRGMLLLALAESMLVNGTPAKGVQASDQGIELLGAQVAARGPKYDMLRSTLAKAYSSRGDLKFAVPGYGVNAAIEDYTRAITAFEELSAENVDPVQWRGSLAMAFMSRGKAKATLPGADLEDAVRDLDSAVALLESLVRDHPDHTSSAWNLTAAISNRAAFRELAGANPVSSSEDLDGAIRGLEEMVARAGAGCSPALLDDLAGLHLNRAVTLAAQNKPFASLFPDFERAIALRNSLIASSAERCPPAWRYKLARSHLALAQSRQLFVEQEADVILKDVERAVALCELALSEVGDQCPADWRYAFALALFMRAEAKKKCGDDNAAVLAGYDEAIEQFELLITSTGAASADEWRNDFGVAYLNRANLKLDTPGFGIATALRDYDLADGQFSLTLARAKKVVADKIQKNIDTVRRARAWCKPLVSVPAEQAAEAIRDIRVSDRILTTSVSVRAVLDAATPAAREQLLAQALHDLSEQW